VSERVLPGELALNDPLRFQPVVHRMPGLAAPLLVEFVGLFLDELRISSFVMDGFEDLPNLNVVGLAILPSFLIFDVNRNSDYTHFPYLMQ